MDKPKKQNDTASESNFEDHELSEDLDQEIAEIDDTAILNELLADLSPDLLDEKEEVEAAADESAEVSSTPAPPKEEKPIERPVESSDKAAIEEEGSWLFDGTLGDEVVEEEPTSAKALETEAPQPAEKAEDTSSWLLDESFMGVEEEEESAAAVSEPVSVEPPIDKKDDSPADDGLFSSESIDAAFSALGMDEEEAEIERVETPTVSEEEPEAVFDASELSAALAEFGSDEGADSESASADEMDEDLANRLTRLAALHYVTRLSVAISTPAPTPVAVEPEEVVSERAVEATEEEPALTADIEDDFVVVEPEEVAVSKSDIPDVSELLSLEFDEDLETVSETDKPEDSLDDLIESAILATEEPDLAPIAEDIDVPTVEEEEAWEEAAEHAVPTSASEVGSSDEGDDELEQLIGEMKARQKRRRIIGTVLAVVIVGVFGYWFFMKGESAPKSTPIEMVADEAIELPEEPIETAATTIPEPPSASVTPPQATAPVTPPPAPLRAPAAPPPARTPDPAPAVSSAIGQYTVHASSYKTLESVAEGRAVWKARGYEQVVVWSWVDDSGTQWYRMGVGRYASREDADNASSTLKSRGFPDSDWARVTKIPEGAH